MPHGDERASLTARAALASIAMALFLVGLKAWAALETSVDGDARLASPTPALDLLASLVMLAGVRIAAMPADKDHRFGHGKAEALAALVQVILITLSGAGHRLARGRAADAAARRRPRLELGIGVSLVAIAVDLRAARLPALRRPPDRIGRDPDRPSPLSASDLLLNLSVIAALVLDQYAGLRRRRPVVRPADRRVAAVRRLERIEPCGRPADGPRMARGGARGLPRGGARNIPSLPVCTTFARAPAARIISSSSMSGCRRLDRRRGA